MFFYRACFRWCYLLSLILLSACTSLQTETEKYERKCSTLLLDSDIVQCYKKANADLLSRRIEMATRRLTEGDLPNSFQVLIQLKVFKTGQFSVESILRPSASRMLDKKILQALGGIDKLYVPHNYLFDTAGFSRMKLIVKPARTPILGSEKLVDNEALVVYIHRLRR